LGSPESAATDVLAAYLWLIENPNVDRKNISQGNAARRKSRNFLPKPFTIEQEVIRMAAIRHKTYKKMSGKSSEHGAGQSGFAPGAADWGTQEQLSLFVVLAFFCGHSSF
jgi:hypothetical protein